MPKPAISLSEATRVWARIGLYSFGGPAAQIALMHRELVEERRWLSEGRFLHALNYCMLLPGPEAQQLATYIGWLMHRTAGGLIAGLLFVLPGFVTILALSMLYAAYGQVALVGAIFYGIKAAILAVVIEAVVRIGKRALRNDVMIAIAAVAFVAIFAFQVPFPLIVLSALAFGLAAHAFADRLLPPPAMRDADMSTAFVIDRLIDERRLPHIVPRAGRTLLTVLFGLALWLIPVAAVAAVFGPQHIFTQLGVFFGKAAMVTFGGAYAVLAYVAQQAVDVFGWLKPGEMIDGLALAESTPGPLIMVVQFVGYLAAFRLDTALSPMTAGFIGSLMTTWVTFAPCFIWIFAGAPYIEALHGNRWLHAALSCVTAAVVGVILNLSVWFAIHVLFAQVDEFVIGAARILAPAWATLDPVSAIIAVASMIALLRFHVGLGRTLSMAALAGFVWKMVLS